MTRPEDALVLLKAEMKHILLMKAELDMNLSKLSERIDSLEKKENSGINTERVEDLLKFKDNL